MTAVELLAKLRELRVTASEDRGLLLLAPRERLTPELIEQARELKPQLLALVANVRDFAAARRRLVAAGAVSVRRPGRVTTSRGPGRLLSLVAQRPEHVTVQLDAEPARAVEVLAVEVEPLDQLEEA